MKSGYVAAVVVAVIVLAALGFWYFGVKKSEAPRGEAGPEALGEALFEKAQNPVKDALPETNPFQTETKTNPLKDVYQNPF